MIATIELPLAFSLGFLAGALYYLGLWLTVRQLPAVKNQALFIFSSFAARIALLALALAVISRGDPLNFLACLAGIVLARWVAARESGKRPGADETAPENSRAR